MKKQFVKLVCLLIAILALGACSNGKEPEATETPGAYKQPEVIRIGVVGENNEDWLDVINRLEEEEGLKVELITFTDYNQPNEALANGDLDLNAFQHKKFLNTYVEESGNELVGIADTIRAPLGIYSNKIASLDELKKGDSIAIASDASNGSRALLVLRNAGLLEIDGKKAGDIVVPSDITKNELEIEIIQLDAAQTSRSLDDLTAAFVNADLAISAGISPIEDAIYTEELGPDTDIYVNIIAARAKDKDNPYYKKIVEYYQSDQTAEILLETFKGAKVPAWKE